jgi:hypothetical protein
VHDHAGGFVHDEELLVLEDDCERYRLWSDLPNDNEGFVDYDPVASHGPIARLLPRPVHCHVPVGDERRRLRPRKRRSVGYNKIEANVSVRLDGKLVPLARAQIS